MKRITTPWSAGQERTINLSQKNASKRITKMLLEQEKSQAGLGTERQKPSQRSLLDLPGNPTPSQEILHTHVKPPLLTIRILKIRSWRRGRGERRPPSRSLGLKLYFVLRGLCFLFFPVSLFSPPQERGCHQRNRNGFVAETRPGKKGNESVAHASVGQRELGVLR